MSIIRILIHILNHPLNKNRRARALINFFKWQLATFIYPMTVLIPFAERSQLFAKKGLTGATSNLYCGLYEFEDMAFTLHFLRDGDNFIDIGANIGSYTILASSECGAISHSFEPIPETFEFLKQNVLINRVEPNVNLYNLGLGAQEGSIKFTSSLDSMNHACTDPQNEDSITVKIKKLDDLITLDKPTLIKIDVEGYEMEVLNGAKLLLESEHLKAIIIEMNGSGEKYGHKDSDIDCLLREVGYEPYEYNPRKRELSGKHFYKNLNTIYIKDIALTRERCTKSRRLKIHDQIF